MRRIDDGCEGTMRNVGLLSVAILHKEKGYLS